jgi:uncharacterized phage protein (TIGR01671 family)
MREILFRAKRIDCNEWVYGFLVANQYIAAKQTAAHNMTDEIFGCFYEVNPETIGQYIGLNDCNGDRIFENDIVEINSQVGMVVYDPAIYRLANKDGDFITDDYPNWDNYIVIGNIHDNPKLLEE